MSKQELSQIALKILGIFALIESVQMISGVINVFGFPEDAPFFRAFMILSMVVPFLLLVWSGQFLIRKAETITVKYFPSGPIENLNIKMNDIQAIAFSIIGVVLIVTTIPKLSQLGINIYTLMSKAKEIGADYNLERNTVGFGINLLIRFILGVLLFFSGESISNIWRRITDRIRYEATITRD